MIYYLRGNIIEMVNYKNWFFQGYPNENGNCNLKFMLMWNYCKNDRNLRYGYFNIIWVWTNNPQGRQRGDIISYIQTTWLCGLGDTVLYYHWITLYSIKTNRVHYLPEFIKLKSILIGIFQVLFLNDTKYNDNRMKKLFSNLRLT